MNKLSAFLHVLVPDAEKIEHNHSNCLKPSTFTDIPSASVPVNPSKDHHKYMAQVHLVKRKLLKGKLSLCVSASLHNAEEKTRKQFNTEEWYQLQAHRITSSTCGLILENKHFLLHQCLYPNPLPSSVAWGQQNEKVACKKYTEFMVRSGHSGLTTQPCGFIIHQMKGWLGTSPDASA